MPSDPPIAARAVARPVAIGSESSVPSVKPIPGSRGESAFLYVSEVSGTFGARAKRMPWELCRNHQIQKFARVG